MRKKFLAVVLAAALACNMTGMTAAAQPAVAGLSVLRGLFGQDEGGGDEKEEKQDATSKDSSEGTSSKKETDKVTLDIGQGDIVISKNGITAVDTAGNPVTDTSSQYVITGSTQDHAVVVEDGVNANIVLSNVNITRTMDGVSPIHIADGSSGTVRVLLEGNNTLQGGPGAAGIQKNCTHTDSSCKCGTLEITCTNTEGGHVCDARCGTLNAAGGSGAAGIGGGTGMSSAKIAIKGGMVTANGGLGGASGGLGTKVNVAGGMASAGNLNGKAGSDANTMNGNTLLFADSAAELQARKGILYQNNAGTVYGNVMLSQGMADLLPADGTLTIPEGASLTVDESTVLPNADNIVGKERLIIKKAKTPTPTPEATPEPEQEMALAAEENVQDEAQARDMVPGSSDITLNITRGDESLNGGSAQYGSTVTLSAVVNRTQGVSSNSESSSPNGEVQFFVDGILLDTKPVTTTDSQVTVTRDVTLTKEGISGLTIKNYGFTAKYTGSQEYGSSQSTQINLNVVAGTLSSIYNNTSWRPNAIAGLKVKDGVDLTREQFDPEVVNGAGKKVNGSWKWDGTDGENTVWPSGTTECKLLFVVDAAEAAYYQKDYTITVIPNPTVADKDKDDRGNDLVKLTLAQGKTKNGEWYNVDSGVITASAIDGGYQLFDSKAFKGKDPNRGDAPNSAAEWAGLSDEWKASIEIPDEFYNGDYFIYAKKVDTGEIIRAVIRNFKVDKKYPLVTKTEFTIGGSMAYLTFQADDEASESGVRMYNCDAQKRLDSAGKYVKPLVAGDGTLTGKSAEDGVFNFQGLSPNGEYDVYLMITDNAGNVTKYLTRIIGDTKDDGTIEFPDKDQRPDQGSPINSNPDVPKYKVQLHYGYEFSTDNADIEGNVQLSATDKNGNPKRGEVAYEDIITATPTVENAEAGTLQYSWWRQLPTSVTPERIDKAPRTPTYVVTADDIGYNIICRVSATNTSQLSYLQADIGPVQKGIYPSDYIPTDGVVDDFRDTFTFQGLAPTKYEYCIDGGKSDTWMPVPDSAGSNTYVIPVGDITVPAGKLLVRAKESDLYRPSDTLASEQNFISTGELKITFVGEARYGEVLTAEINSEAIDPADITYEWSYEDGTKIDNSGNSYQLRKEDIDKRIQVKAILRGFEDINNTELSDPVRKREVNAVINVADKEYDGTTAAEASINFDGLINGDDLSSTVEVEFVDKNAGEDKEMKVGKKGTITGADAGCYVVKWPSNSDVKGTIRPKQLTLSMTAEDKVYDGTTDAVVNLTSAALAGDSVQVSGTGEFADKNAGTNKTVTSKDVVVTGTDAANYTAIGSTATATASITPKEISIEGITVADKVYDTKTDAVIAVTFAGAVDEVSYTYKASFESANVGMDKRVTATVTLSGDSAKNYILASGEITGVGNIVKALAPYEESNTPQNLTGIEGKKLSSVYIGSGFKWKEPNTVMEEVGRHTYDALYNPDPSQYGDRPIRLEVLVQCAKHTWGDWSTTVEPTKTELGERQRICSVCGYIEVETVPRAPYITTEDTKEGWGDIIQAINNASSGTEIPVTMNGTETLPASVQEALQGRDVSLVLQMADGITWTLRGQDITGSVLKDINLAVTLYTDNIPTDVLDPYLQGQKTAVQIHLAYSGEFGFTATLRVPLGNEFAGVNSTFYYYNPNRERLEQMDSNRITSDGIGRYDLTHASDYVTIIDSQNGGGGGSASENSPTPSPSGGGTNNTATPGGSGNAGQTTTTGTAAPSASPTGAARTTSGNAGLLSINAAKTSDETPITNYVMLLLLGAAGVTVIGAYRHSRKKDRSR